MTAAQARTSTSPGDLVIAGSPTLAEERRHRWALVRDVLADDALFARLVVAVEDPHLDRVLAEDAGLVNSQNLAHLAADR